MLVNGDLRVRSVSGSKSKERIYIDGEAVVVFRAVYALNFLFGEDEEAPGVEATVFAAID